MFLLFCFVVAADVATVAVAVVVLLLVLVVVRPVVAAEKSAELLPQAQPSVTPSPSSCNDKQLTATATTICGPNSYNAANDLGLPL